jgi:anti-sigma factor RsiW
MPSQENENAMDGLLRRSLARDSSAGSDCPDAELLAAYFDQSLGADEAARYEIHFSTCPRCREQLAAMARASTEQIVQPDLALEPALARARPAQALALDAARVPAQAKPTPASAARPEMKETVRKSPDARWLRWLIPVAAMLVLGTVVFVRFASHQTTVGLNNQIALSKSAPSPQEQTALEPEKKATDVEARKNSAPTDQPSVNGTPDRSPSSAKPAAGSASNSESSRMQRNEGASARGGTASRNAPAAAPRPSLGIAGRASALQSKKQVGGATQGAVVQENRDKASEPAPAAPAPELNASLPSIIVATSSADAVKSPAPAPPPSAEKKSQTFELKSRNLHGSAAANSLAKAKPAEERYTETVIATPDSDVFYRIAKGGFVEISDDGGVTWQGQLLNPSAEFTAGSAPEPRVCWLVGRSGIVFLTEDGKNWRKLPSPTSEDLVIVVAKSASTATVTANDDRKWSTDDAGKNWRPVK